MNDTRNDDSKKIKGVRIRTFNNVVIILSCIMYITLICISAVLPSKYTHLIQNTDEYTACSRYASMIHEASDYLTEQARLYVQNRDIVNLKLYFQELNVTRRREQALENLKKYNLDSEVRGSFNSALKYSNALAEREIYAMKLVAVGSGCNLASLPSEIQNTVLSSEDEALMPEEMIEKAKQMVFNSEYQSSKNLINECIFHFSDSILRDISQRRNLSIEALNDTLLMQHICIGILLVITIFIFVVIQVLIINPLKHNSGNLKENRMLDIVGAYEIKHMAKTYNDIYKLNAEHKSLLMEKAEHDPLTGILNRISYDKIKNLLKDSPLPVAIVVLDIDQFKQVNDRFGHEAGDRVLKSVASILRGSFRSDDYVIRFGGDEFVIILKDMPLQNSSIIKRKFEKINAFLKNPEDDLPAVSFSAGAAFSESGFTEELFMKADKALYRAKNEGRGRCCFYDECDIFENGESEE